MKMKDGNKDGQQLSIIIDFGVHKFQHKQRSPSLYIRQGSLASSSIVYTHIMVDGHKLQKYSA